MKADISIILPYQNNEATISATIRSILNQTFRNFELLLINLNSTDKSVSFARQFASENAMVRHLDEGAKEIVSAFNTGLEMASGKYISVMDPRDVANPLKLEKQYQYLENNADCTLVSCCVDYVNDERMQYDNFEYIKWTNKIITFEDIRQNQFINNPVILSSILFRRVLKDENILFHLGDFPEDYEFLLRLLGNHNRMHKLPEKLIEWYDQPGRMEKTLELSSSITFAEIKTYYLFMWLKNNNPFHPKVLVWGAGRFARQRFSLLRDLGIQPKFFIDFHANPQYNVVEYTHVPPAGNNFIVAYSNNPEIREKIREFLLSINYSEGRDFIFFH